MALVNKSDHFQAQGRSPMTDSSPPSVFTIGHSNRTLTEFVDLLRNAQVSMVVDVRSFPRSRANPQFNRDTLPDELANWQIGHQYVEELGGRRKRSQEIPTEVNAFWENQSFHNYADYALSTTFRHGLERLLELSHDRRCAIMCSEAVWWRCHRRFVTDYLIARGRSVMHIMGGSRIEEAKMNPAAVQAGEGLEYPAQ